MNPFVRTPCEWPNRPAAGLPVPQSSALLGIQVLENATVPRIATTFARSRPLTRRLAVGIAQNSDARRDFSELRAGGL